MTAYRIWQIAGWTMLHYFWVGAALGLTALAVRRCLRSASAGTRYFAALGSLLLMTVAPAATAVYVAHDLGPLPSDPPTAVQIQDVQSPPRKFPVEDSRPGNKVAEAPPTLPAASEPVAQTPAPVSVTKRLVEILDRAAGYLPWLWIVGSPLAFLLTTAGLVGAERLRRQSRPVEDARIAELCRRLAASLKISCRVAVAVCDRIAGPILVGIVRPVVLLPAAALAGWDPQQLEMVLLHELVHVRRYDNLVNLLQRIVESALFFHPFVWILSGWVRREREHCCDAAVVAHTRQPQAYAQLLVTLAEQLSRNSVISSSLAYPQVVSSMAQPSLVGRIRSILKKEEQSMQVSRKTVGLVFGVLVTLAALIVGRFTLPIYAAGPKAASKPDDVPGEPNSAIPPENEAKPAASPAERVAATAPIPPELQKPIVGKNYLIIPLHAMTELQRNLSWDAADTRLFVVINGRAVLNDKDTQLDASAFNFWAFAQALYKYKAAGVRGRTQITIDGAPEAQGDESTAWTSAYAAGGSKQEAKEPPWRASEAFTALLNSLAKVIGPVKVASNPNRKAKNAKEWKTLVAELSTPPTEEAIRGEAGVSDGLMAAYAITTPLTRYMVIDHLNCVVRNVKPLSDMTPKEISSLRERAKPLVAKLGLRQPPCAAFLVAYGNSWSKIRRAEPQLGLNKSWPERSKAMGVNIPGLMMWDAGRVGVSTKLRVRVVGDDGEPVKDAAVTSVFPPDARELFKYDLWPFQKEKDGSWLCGSLPDDEEFTLTVTAPGYAPQSQKLKVKLGETKELEVKLKKAGEAANPPQNSTKKPKGQRTVDKSGVIRENGKQIGVWGVDGSKIGVGVD